MLVRTSTAQLGLLFICCRTLWLCPSPPNQPSSLPHPKFVHLTHHHQKPAVCPTQAAQADVQQRRPALLSPIPSACSFFCTSQWSFLHLTKKKTLDDLFLGVTASIYLQYGRQPGTGRTDLKQFSTSFLPEKVLNLFCLACATTTCDYVDSQLPTHPDSSKYAHPHRSLRSSYHLYSSVG